jgi:Zn-dependent M28 family amino/carboxypeptidase
MSIIPLRLLECLGKGAGIMAVVLMVGCEPGIYEPAAGEGPMIRMEETRERLHQHIRELTVAIGERSVFLPANLKRTETYIESVFRGMGLPVTLDTYPYQNTTVANVIATLDFGDHPTRCLVVGAHYDSVMGTVGADDNASAVAVLLETARWLAAQLGKAPLDLRVSFVAFALEEPPVFATRYMGSRVYAKRAKKTGERIDGMICLEMVGYTCKQPGCQRYPLPLMFRKYPREGNFIGVVGNFGSRAFTRSIAQAFRRNPDLPVVTLTVPFSGWLLPSVRLSDHSPFWDQGYEAVMVTDTAFFRNPYYHSAADTIDKLDFHFMAELVESLVIFLVDQGKAPGGAG